MRVPCRSGLYLKPIPWFREDTARNRFAEAQILWELLAQWSIVKTQEIQGQNVEFVCRP